MNIKPILSGAINLVALDMIERQSNEAMTLLRCSYRRNVSLIFLCNLKANRGPMHACMHAALQLTEWLLWYLLHAFRSLEDAVNASRDGDTIVLLRGVHNSRGSTLTLSKRVRVLGEGQLGEARVDHRGNCPLFTISRCF